jgi:hypothetical protein
VSDAVEPYTDLPPVVRFRFRLKTLFVIITLVCILLGLKLAHERRARAILSRHKSLIEALTANVLSPPQDTVYITPPGDASEIASRLNFSCVDQFHFLAPGGPARVGGQTFVLDVSKSPRRKQGGELGQMLTEYYAKGLSRLGMKQRQAVYGAGLNGRWSRCVWVSSDYDLTVVIDSDISADDNRAEIRILVIDGQSHELW